MPEARPWSGTDPVVAGSVHDLNNLLGAIRNLAHLVGAENPSPQTDADLQKVDQAVEEAAKILKRLSNTDFRGSTPNASSTGPPGMPSDTVLTILVVDDEPVVLDVTSRLLRREGYRVLKADSHLAAMAVAGSNELHLLLTDSLGPAEMGWVRLQELQPGCAILHMSGRHDRGFVGDPGPGGPRNTIDKPFSREQLVAKVSETLASRDPASRDPASSDFPWTEGRAEP